MLGSLRLGRFICLQLTLSCLHNCWDNFEIIVYNFKRRIGWNSATKIKYICSIQAVFLQLFPYTCLLTCRIWFRVMLMWGHNTTFYNYIVFTHHDITSWHHWWCHLAHVSGPIKGLAPHHRGFTPSSSPNGWGGTHACIDWRADAPTLLEPTSFKLNWLGSYQFSISICPCGHANTLWELPGNAVFDLTSTNSTGPLCLSVGAHVHCLLSCQVYISGSMLSSGETIHPTLHVSQLLVFTGWAPTEYDTSGPNCEFHSTSVVSQVTKCSYRKEGEQQYTLAPGGLTSWIEMASWTWQAADPTLTQQDNWSATHHEPLHSA